MYKNKKRQNWKEAYEDISADLITEHKKKQQCTLYDYASTAEDKKHHP
jgi:virulence-associated protein VapD